MNTHNQEFSKKLEQACDDVRNLGDLVWAGEELLLANPGKTITALELQDRVATVFKFARLSAIEISTRLEHLSDEIELRD